MKTVLYWAPQTRSSRAVWLLEELGVAYDLVRIDIGDPESCRNEAFLAVSPMGKVPALVHDGVGVFDSAALALYMADVVPEAGLAPAAGSPERGDYLSWMVYTPGYIEPAMAERFSGMSPNRRSHGWGDFDAVLDVLSERLEGRDWLLDSGFSAADILVGSGAHFMRMFGILPEDRTAISNYADRCLARPAYAKALAMDSEAAASPEGTS